VSVLSPLVPATCRVVSCEVRAMRCGACRVCRVVRTFLVLARCCTSSFSISMIWSLEERGARSQPTRVGGNGARRGYMAETGAGMGAEATLSWPLRANALSCSSERPPV
jgi:hypothetical protein